MVRLTEIVQDGRFKSGRLVGEHKTSETENIPWNGSPNDNKGFIRGAF